MHIEYQQLIENKRHTSQNFGIKPTWMPDAAFDFQKYGAEYSILKGRNAVFFDTGLGKTIIELIHAVNYVRATNKPILILTPLAVAFQFIKEAEKFGIDDVEYSKNGRYTKKIIICNYERLHHFNPSDFECVICDESSILKNFEGETRNAITSFMKKVKYRYLFTATPSPNDFEELGTSSEALGYLGYVDMLNKFFTNNEDTISPQNIGTEWRLKGHAENAFFEWVSSWSISARKPSDLGAFDDSRYILPELITRFNTVKNEKPLCINGQMQMFNIVARTNSEVLAERKSTIEPRCEEAVKLTSANETSVYWCNLNSEGDLLEKLDPNAVQIKGTMPIEKKEEILLSFASGQIKHLITKPTITGFGLNWQHCAHTTYFPTFSYEQYYQAIRRFWRFGQTQPVTVDLILSDGQKRVMDSLMAKAKKADELFSKLNTNLHKNFEIAKRHFDKPLTLPSFLN